MHGVVLIKQQHRSAISWRCLNRLPARLSASLTVVLHAPNKAFEADPKIAARFGAHGVSPRRRFWGGSTLALGSSTMRQAISRVALFAEWVYLLPSVAVNSLKATVLLPFVDVESLNGIGIVFLVLLTDVALISLCILSALFVWAGANKLKTANKALLLWSSIGAVIVAIGAVAQLLEPHDVPMNQTYAGPFLLFGLGAPVLFPFLHVLYEKVRENRT
jgi:hypothetical protein